MSGMTNSSGTNWNEYLCNTINNSLMSLILLPFSPKHLGLRQCFWDDVRTILPEFRSDAYNHATIYLCVDLKNDNDSKA